MCRWHKGTSSTLYASWLAAGMHTCTTHRRSNPHEGGNVGAHGAGARDSAAKGGGGGFVQDFPKGRFALSSLFG